LRLGDQDDPRCPAHQGPALDRPLCRMAAGDQVADDAAGCRRNAYTASFVISTIRPSRAEGEPPSQRAALRWNKLMVRKCVSASRQRRLEWPGNSNSTRTVVANLGFDSRLATERLLQPRKPTFQRQEHRTVLSR